MRVARSLGRRGLGSTWPNPAVGCVLVTFEENAQGRLLAQGWTQPGGRPHAERVALDAAAGDARLRGATAYVTLEPCAHHGKTPPCAAALIDSGVARVVFGHVDPDPRVAGKGHARLAEAGVALTTGVLAGPIGEDLAGYLLRQRAGRPLVTLKLAASLDGRIATASGESRWITGPAARARAHLLRAESDAILVGSGTALADDPSLDVRLPGLERRSPVRLVADSALRLPLGSKLVRSAKERPLWVLHADTCLGDAEAAARGAALEAAGAILIPAPRRGEGLDLVAALDALGARGVTSVFCEGGGRLAAGLIAAGRVDRLVWAGAGLLLGADGHPAVGDLGLDTLAAAPRFRLTRFERLGGDVWSEWRPRADSD